MKVLITGGNGLLAHALRQRAAAHMELVLLGHRDFDLTQPDLMADRLRELRPAVVINTAAYNHVDRCEQDRELSWAVNAEGPKVLARICAEAGCRLVHFGTDYVFDGLKQAPYLESDATHPLNHYGAGKLAGETAVLEADPRHLVLRTSWLFGPHPTQAKSYVHTVLRHARAGTAVKATTDQAAAPTYVDDLAQWTLHWVCQGTSGLWHAVNDEGVSRFEWTQAILAAATRAGLFDGPVSVEPVTSAYFSQTMRRPDYTVLDNRKAAGFLGRALGSWRLGLELMLQNWPRR